jgi:intraflagellar transport protein 81
MELLL